MSVCISKRGVPSSSVDNEQYDVVGNFLKSTWGCRRRGEWKLGNDGERHKYVEAGTSCDNFLYFFS